MVNNFYKTLNDSTQAISNILFPSNSLNPGYSLQWSIVDSREVYSGISTNNKIQNSLYGDKFANTLFKVIPYCTPNLSNSTQCEMRNVDRPIITAGSAPTKPTEILISSNFAMKNSIRINDQIIIQSLPYTVVGFATSYDMLYPEFDPLNKIPNTKTASVIYCNYDAYYNGNNFQTTSVQDREIYIVGRTIKDHSSSYNYVGDLGDANFNFEKLIHHAQPDRFQNNIIIAKDIPPAYANLANAHYYNISNSTYQYYARSNSFDAFLLKSEEFLAFFMIILLITSIFIIFIITRKRVYQDIGKIAIFKANGYHNWEISLAYVMFAIVTSFVGIILGSLFSLLSYYAIFSGYISFFMLPTIGVQFDVLNLFYNSLIANGFIIGFVTFITYLILYININKNTVQLMNKGN